MHKRADNSRTLKTVNRPRSCAFSFLSALLLLTASASILPALDLQTAQKLYKTGDYAACSQAASVQLASTPWMESW
jgi:hypothetical protein